MTVKKPVHESLKLINEYVEQIDFNGIITREWYEDAFLNFAQLFFIDKTFWISDTDDTNDIGYFLAKTLFHFNSTYEEIFDHSNVYKILIDFYDLDPQRNENKVHGINTVCMNRLKNENKQVFMVYGHTIDVNQHKDTIVVPIGYPHTEIRALKNEGFNKIFYFEGVW